MGPKSVEGKTQPSIHSFFKRKTPPSSPVRPSHSSVEPLVVSDDDDVVDLTASPPPKKAKLQNGSAATAQRKTALAQTTSSYFAKTVPPTSEPISERGKPAVETSTAKTSLETYKLKSSRPAPSSQSGAAFQAFAAPASAPENEAGPSRTAEQERRRQAWERKLVSGRLVPRRRSLKLDEAAATEARIAAGLVDAEDVEEGTQTPALDEPILAQDDVEEQSAPDLGESKFKKYAAKGSDVANGKGRKKKKEEVGPSGMTYTPLERQFMEAKASHPDVLLLMEVGYKFHGDDAKTAARELGIVSFPSRNFYTASIPTHRLHIHVKKLISLGYKVGVVSQMETAALKKVSDNRNAPFTRELTHLFTAATYVEDPSLPSSSTMADDPIIPGSAPPPTNALVALVEQQMGGMTVDERVRIAIVSVTPDTGDVVWDIFEDSPVRTELETRLTHLSPAELLLPAAGLSKATEKVLKHFAGITRASSGSSVRVERIDNVPKHSAAFDMLTEFYKSKSRHQSKRDRDPSEIDLTGDYDSVDVETKSDQEVNRMDMDEGQNGVESVDVAAGVSPEHAVLALVDFPKSVVIALAIAVTHMKSFKLENAFRHRSSFTRFINRAHMLLSSNTLVNLEIYRNQTDGGIYGSLLWLLDHTKTRMGRRLLREWIGRPLLNVGALQARIDAVDEIMTNATHHMEKLRSLLVNMPDLVRGLTRVQYGKATPSEIATILVGLERVGKEFKPFEGEIFSSSLLNHIVRTLPTIREKATDFLSAINIKSARENDEANLWQDPDKYPSVQDAKDCIAICESELDQHLKEIRKILKRPSLSYVTVSGIEYLVEVPVRDSKSVPPRWVKMSSTKHVVRFHTPDILRIIKEREQHKETLTAASRAALLDFQSDISECHDLVVVSKQLAVIDCLMSLAQVAAASGYCKPHFVAKPELHIQGGRHPMVEMLRDEAYVPFDIAFSDEEGAAKVITGPNMAGKSSCVRATALIVCMAQIGSFVPAQAVTLGIHDAVQTRMGASDDISRGKSTFMVELSETSDILRTVTPRTLLILDELGRGTSTYDGVAIAYATLSHLAGIGCSTLFVTHYPTVAEELAKEYPNTISNWHMAFDEVKMPDGSAEITFLYKLTRGLAEASFGVWCARLAGLPQDVLLNAQTRSDQLKVETSDRILSSVMRRTRALLHDLPNSTPTPTRNATDLLNNASALHRALHLLDR